jgi:hypothetical protein
MQARKHFSIIHNSHSVHFFSWYQSLLANTTDPPMASSSTDSATTTLQLPSFTSFSFKKLEGPGSYLNWVSQFTPILKSYELMGIVDGTESCPSKFMCDESRKLTSNVSPVHSLCQKNDQYIVSWFTTTLSNSVLSSIYGLNIARQVWTTLASQFASQLKARTSYLKKQLQSL